MSDTLFDISQYQSHAHMSESPDWRDATGTAPAWEQPDHELDLGVNSQRPVDDAITQWRSEVTTNPDIWVKPSVALTSRHTTGATSSLDINVQPSKSLTFKRFICGWV